MLTADLVRPRLRTYGDELRVQSLDLKKGEQTAADLLRLFGEYVGKTQGQWAEALEQYTGDRTDYIVIRGLAKVLEDAATFTPLTPVIDPATLRERLFTQGPVFAEGDLFHPRTRTDVLAELAIEFNTVPDALETALYADRPAEYTITEPGQTWTPADLIARYNLELARAVLYWSDEMTITIYDTFKDFWRYLKLFKLMFMAIPHEGGYRVQLDGPISPFVQSTTRYGRQFAAFLPALFLCERWTMQATVRPPEAKEKRLYRLDSTAPLKSHFKRSSAFDSRLEADFAAEFSEKFGDVRGKWLLSREDEVLLLGDTVMIPDFALTHTDGRRALVELMGYWHPDYIRRKLAKVRAAGRSDLILLVYEGVNLTGERLDDLPVQLLYFKNKPVLKEVIAAAERCAV